MKNITLSADERVIAKARAVARRQGKSLNQLVREYLESLTSESDPNTEFQRLRELSALSAGQRPGWRFDRDEIHERR